MSCHATICMALTLFVVASAATTYETQFYPSKFPESVTEIGSAMASPWMSLDGVPQKTMYHEIARSGQNINGKIFGAVRMQNGEYVKTSTTSLGDEGHASTHPDVMISDMEDFASVLRSKTSDSKKLWSVVHFEDTPAAFQAVELKQEEDGVLTPVNLYDIDFSSHGGLYGTCAGSVSPWNTHLGGEEWGVPDARDFESWETDEDIGSRNQLSMRYYNLYPDESGVLSLSAVKAVFHPYKNGYVNEVWVDDTGDAPVFTATKHYSMGRYAIELPKCVDLSDSLQMCYIMDDNTNGLPCAFKPVTKNDLSSGQLLCAKVTQTSAKWGANTTDPGLDYDGGEFDVTWLDMGSTTDAEIKAAVDANTQFADLFEVDSVVPGATTLATMCAEGFTGVNVGMGAECLKLKPNMAILASRLETRRYASILGASTEWTKMEGITFDPKRKEFYMAMSTVYRSMEGKQNSGSDSLKYDLGGNDDISVRLNPCGCVYRMPYDETTGLVTHIQSLVCGNYKGGNADEANKCDIHTIANPDNIAFMEGHDKLFIGEDTSNHENNVVWVYDMESSDLARIMTVPKGAETTGVYYHADINGFAYIMNQVQHPGADTVYGRAGAVGYMVIDTKVTTAASHTDADTPECEKSGASSVHLVLSMFVGVFFMCTFYACA